jgi:glucose/arabinose dehydrogenase
MTIGWRAARAAASVCVMLAIGATAVGAATLPAGFTEALVASGLNNPTAMQFAPDGRLFVCEQGGRLRVIKNGALLSTPFLTVTVSSSGERGLLGVAFDPNFAVNQYVYVYYTATSPTIHNRVSRFTANGDVAVPGSEVALLDLETLSATNHNGGALAFGPDEMLYIAVGENAVPSNAQSLGNRLGKILRVNKDGTIPASNPFFTTATGANRAIWALGLRNPFTFAFNASGTSLFINDVGQGTWEEINEGRAGANYGWPTTEGSTTDPRFDSPRHAYPHSGSSPTPCAIAGGAFYTPAAAQFPSDYLEDYFFADYCAGWIRRLDPVTNMVTGFATGISSPVDLKVADDGSLYYLARGGGGSVYRISYGATTPTITSHPVSRTVAPGAPVTFSVRASGPPPLGYQWQRNGSNISGATSSDYTIASVAATDNGARFRAIVSNDYGSTTSAEAVLTVTSNQAPSATITSPAAGTLYSGGQVITYTGSGSDPEDGALPASAFTWQVDFHHDAHIHPFVPATSGATGGSFTIPTTGHTESNVWYRVYLTVRDAAGATRTVQRDILPRKVSITLATSPAGLQLRLDGQPISTPLTFDAVVGIVRSLEAAASQSSGGTTYEFVSWSDGGAAAHTVNTPAANTTYTATYRTAGGGGTGTGLSATYFNNMDFTGSTVSRTDPAVDFAWGSGSPAAAIGPDTFSARWTGQIEAPFSGAYTFYTVSDDGVRLWVNGVQVVNQWNDHAPAEHSGTIALTAGQRYDIRMEHYENGGGATARLLWSHGSIPKTVVPAARLYPTAAVSTIRINFQPAASPVPAGYLADGGAVYAARGNGQTYGWNADNAAQARDRNAASSPDQAYDTLTHLQKPANPNAFWEIALPNGSYTVRIVSGDASHYDSILRLAAEGVMVVSGTPTSSSRWVEGTATVTVADGRLTLTNASGASNNKICFVEITAR